MTTQKNGQHILKIIRGKNRNVESYHKNTTIKNCGKLYSGPDNQIRTGIIFPFRTIYPSNNKPTKGNQYMFIQEIPGPHRVIDREESIKYMNTTMVHLHIILQGLQSTINKNTYTELEDK